MKSIFASITFLSWEVLSLTESFGHIFNNHSLKVLNLKVYTGLNSFEPHFVVVVQLHSLIFTFLHVPHFLK